MTTNDVLLYWIGAIIAGVIWDEMRGKHKKRMRRKLRGRLRTFLTFGKE